METLVISDTHLFEFDQAKFDFLNSLFSRYQKIIINGDFWDGWYFEWEDFLKSEWKGLLPTLNRRDVTYIIGNHDLMKSQSAVGVFCTQQMDSYKMRIGDITYHFEHGHKLSEKVIHNRLFKKYASFVEAQHRPLLLAMHKLERLVGKIYPQSLFNTSVGYKRNQLVKQFYKASPVYNVDFYIIGDTHAQELDIEAGFANSGSVAYGHAHFLVIKEDGISLRYERY